MSTHLQTIVTRQRSSRLRDALFACSVAIASLISISSVATAASAASTHVAQR
jgi:hypothetical protein